eukprot:1146234-Pelagomonas_calceolata.AAC.2
MPNKIGSNIPSKELTGYPYNLQISPYHSIIITTWHLTIGGRSFNPFPTTPVPTHTSALKHGQPSILPITKRRSHFKSRTGKNRLHRWQEKKRKEKKNYAVSETLPTSVKERGPHWCTDRMNTWWCTPPRSSDCILAD